MVTKAVTVSNLAISVKVSQEPDSHTFYGTVTVLPQGKPSRDATVGEVVVRLQDRTLGYWRTITQAETAQLGVYTFVRTPRLDSGHYRMAAQHKASIAEVGMEFDINTYFDAINWGAQYEVNAGMVMPSLFQQARPQRGLAFPEVRQWPTSGANPDMPGTLIRVRQDGVGVGPGHRMPRV